jgi:GNAT superfamily N-acetyltransferase/uncharacterized protein YndB with AHSA1/START domain
MGVLPANGSQHDARLGERGAIHPSRCSLMLRYAMSGDDEVPRIASASREIAAGAGRIFDLIADPAQQPRWDGNDNLAQALHGQRVRAVGDVFTMTLTRGSVRENHVVEFDEGRCIAWRPAEAGHEPPGHLWRWELEPIGPSRTRVTHTYDWTQLNDVKRFPRARATTPDRLQGSLARLAAVAERKDVFRSSGPPASGGLAEEEVLTYLHMLSPVELRPAPVRAAPLAIIELDRHSPLVRSTTLSIGRAHDWPSQSWGEEQWQAYLDRPNLRHWAAVLDDEVVGLLSLDVPPGGDVEIDTFGLLPSHIGRGLGGHFLTLSVQLAWDLAPLGSRVWLHTSDRDHPAALPNYQRRGFQHYQVGADGPVTASGLQ